MRRLIFPILLGLFGCAILVSLGVWQWQRLQWKEGVLAQIESRIAADPMPLPLMPDPEADRYLPVTVAGRLSGAPLWVLTTVPGRGGGYRLIAPLETDTGRRVLIDLGFLPLDTGPGTDIALPAGDLAILGNLHWPDEVDRWTPAPEGDLWFARDVGPLAAALDTEPILIVARQIAGADLPTMPVPVGTEGISNNHLEYVVTWFGLALVWAAMSAYLIARLARRKDDA